LVETLDQQLHEVLLGSVLHLGLDAIARGLLWVCDVFLIKLATTHAR
jgi:hypothetical protein